MDDQYSDYRGGYGGRPAYAKPRYTQVASRPKRYTRSSSHSRSRSVSRTPSGSRSRSRSSSRSYESRDHKNKRVNSLPRCFLQPIINHFASSWHSIRMNCLRNWKIYCSSQVKTYPNDHNRTISFSCYQDFGYTFLGLIRNFT